MPFARDKVLLNGRTHRGMKGAYFEELANAKQLTGEIQDAGLLLEFEQEKAELHVICTELRKAEMKALNAQYEWNERVSEKLDQLLTAASNPTP